MTDIESRLARIKIASDGRIDMPWLIETIEELMRQNAIARSALEQITHENMDPSGPAYGAMAVTRKAKAEMNRGEAK